VAKKSDEPSLTRLESGWGELQEGRWEEARTRFEQAVGAEQAPAAEYAYEYLLVVARKSDG
jgi:hypothetical protein